jgi:hypothetical protein
MLRKCQAYLVAALAGTGLISLALQDIGSAGRLLGADEASAIRGKWPYCGSEILRQSCNNNPGCSRDKPPPICLDGNAACWLICDGLEVDYYVSTKKYGPKYDRDPTGCGDACVNPLCVNAGNGQCTCDCGFTDPNTQCELIYWTEDFCG